MASRSTANAQAMKLAIAIRQVTTASSNQDVGSKMRMVFMVFNEHIWENRISSQELTDGLAIFFLNPKKRHLSLLAS